MSEMTRDEARAQVCKAVMGATRVAMPISVIGRRHVGVSQSWMGGGICMVAGSCPHPPEVTIQVPGQHGQAPALAWAVLRSSFAEILSREELRELDGEKGEHVRDACAIFLAAVPRWEEMQREMRARA